MKGPKQGAANEHGEMKMSDEIHSVPDFEAHPVRVTLCFKSRKDRDEFMGGLSDGFGENFCDLDYECWLPRDPHKQSRGFAEATMFTVEVFKPED